MISPLLLLLATAVAQETPAPPTEAPSAEPAQARSQEDMDRALELYDNGRKLFDEANYRDAIAAWEASYELSNRPALLFNIANAWERLASYDEAIRVLNRYRAFASADEREAIERRIRNLERLAQDARERAAVAPAEPAAPSEAPKEVVSTPATPPPAPVEPVAPRRRASGQRVVGIGLIGAGAVALGAGAGLGLASRAAGSRAAENCATLPGGGMCMEQAQQDVQANRGLATWADVGFVVGAVSAVTGGVLVLTSPKARVAVGPNSVTFGGRF